MEHYLIFGANYADIDYLFSVDSEQTAKDICLEFETKYEQIEKAQQEFKIFYDTKRTDYDTQYKTLRALLPFHEEYLSLRKKQNIEGFNSLTEPEQKRMDYLWDIRKEPSLKLSKLAGEFNSAVRDFSEQLFLFVEHKMLRKYLTNRIYIDRIFYKKENLI